MHRRWHLHSLHTRLRVTLERCSSDCDPRSAGPFDCCASKQLFIDRLTRTLSAFLMRLPAPAFTDKWKQSQLPTARARPSLACGKQAHQSI